MSRIFKLGSMYFKFVIFIFGKLVRNRVVRLFDLRINEFEVVLFVMFVMVIKSCFKYLKFFI